MILKRDATRAACIRIPWRARGAVSDTTTRPGDPKPPHFLKAFAGFAGLVYRQDVSTSKAYARVYNAVH